MGGDAVSAEPELREILARLHAADHEWVGRVLRQLPHGLSLHGRVRVLDFEAARYSESYWIRQLLVDGVARAVLGCNDVCRILSIETELHARAERRAQHREHARRYAKERERVIALLAPYYGITRALPTDGVLSAVGLRFIGGQMGGVLVRADDEASVRISARGVWRALRRSVPAPLTALTAQLPDAPERFAAWRLRGERGRRRSLRAPFGLARQIEVLDALGLRVLYNLVLAEIVAGRRGDAPPRRWAREELSAVAHTLAIAGGLAHAVRWCPLDLDLCEDGDIRRWLDVPTPGRPPDSIRSIR